MLGSMILPCTVPSYAISNSVGLAPVSLIVYSLGVLLMYEVVVALLE
jgi:hypothetical protein